MSPVEITFCPLRTFMRIIPVAQARGVVAAASRARAISTRPPAISTRQLRLRDAGSRGALAKRGARGRSRVCCAALPSAATEVLTAVADKLLSVLVFTVGLWPIGLMWVANLQLPVGDVAVKKSKDEWRTQLSPEEYKVLIKRGTERAGTSPYDKLWDEGTYVCKGCGAPLFESSTKFNSGTGWPSFYDIIPGKVDLTLQLMYCLGDLGARECRCHDCGGHLGHVFSDGPKPTGKRYCINGVSLDFKRKN